MKISTRLVGLMSLFLAYILTMATTVTARANANFRHTQAIAVNFTPLSASSAVALRQGVSGTSAASNSTQTTLDAKAASATLSIYPNPSKGMVVVTVNQKTGTDYKLRLSNILGREIRSFSLRPEAANVEMPLNLSDLPAGMYFYSLVLHDKVVSTKRFVLQN